MQHLACLDDVCSCVPVTRDSKLCSLPLMLQLVKCLHQAANGCKPQAISPLAAMPITAHAQYYDASQSQQFLCSTITCSFISAWPDPNSNARAPQ